MRKLTKIGYTAHGTGQTGFALVTGLIFLAVLTILVLAALRSTLFQELMARGTGARLNAFQAAEAVLRQVETDIFAPGGIKGSAMTPVDNDFDQNGFTSTCNNGFCTQVAGETSGSTPSWKAVDWTSTTNTKASTLTIAGMSSLRYVVECLGNCSSPETPSGCTPVFFRVTARASPAYGGKAMVQSVYSYKPGDCPTVLEGS